MNDHMTISSYLRGGLGNQLFIYAAVRQVQERLIERGKSVSLYFDIQRSTKSNRLPYYNVVENVTYGRVKLSPRQKATRHFLWRRYFNADVQYNRPYDLMGITLRNRIRLQNAGLILCENGYIPVENDLPYHQSIIMDGFFQSEKFFPHIREELLAELTPKAEMLPKNQSFSRLIGSATTVCLSVRMGDYMGQPMYQVCTPKYYCDAIRLMQWLHPDCRFVLFSDDVEAARKLLPLPEDTVSEEGDDPDYETLRLMSQCKHFIISNSSFNWWAQYLCTQPNPTVIAPNRWYNKPIPCDAAQKHWILLPVD